MFRALISFGSNKLFSTPLSSATGVPENDHAELSGAKASAARHIQNNKSSAAQGYEVYIIDLDKHIVASYATVPVQNLDWKDSA